MDCVKVLNQLTLEEKCALLSGINFWDTTPIARVGVPSVKVADGPHGLRREVKLTGVGNVMQQSAAATCFPTAVTLASSWNPSLAGEIAGALANEAKEQKVQTVLGPGTNIKRNPLCGRNFEYFSEDPYLAGEIAAAYVNGLQAEKVGTSLKHFAANSQEFKRFVLSSEVDERALREIYLQAFEKTVKRAQPYTIMCSYNLINGVHSSDNKWLLTDVLRDEWGYKGIVVSDWGAVNDRVKGVLAGLDLEMPSSAGLNDREVLTAVRDGTLKEDDLNKVVLRMLEYIDKCTKNKNEHGDFAYDYTKSHALARKAASQGAVLLKNDEKLLPLSEDDDFAVIGYLAKNMRYQGSGSSQINPINLVSFTEMLDREKVKYSYCDGVSEKGDGRDEALKAEAVALAKKSKKVLLFIGLTPEYESEGYDRTHLDLPIGHNELVDAVSAVNDNVTVVLSMGSPVTMPWISKVKAILNLYLGGEAVGEAAYDVIFGKVNPSGKLAETFPLSLESNPAYGEKYFKAGPKTVEYRESIFVGYRYFDAAKKDVLFPFGYGLSYTNFEYGAFAVETDGKNSATVRFTIENVGDVDGAEVAQVYVKDVESTIFREEKALAGFAKVFLRAGEKKEVEITLDARAFSFYNVNKHDWTIEKGDFELSVGASSRDIKFKSVITLDGETDNIPDCRATASEYYDMENTKEFSDSSFSTVLGRELTPNVAYTRATLDYNATLLDVREVSCFGKFVCNLVMKFSGKLAGKDASDVTKEMIRQSAVVMPMRAIFAMTNGAVPKKAVDGLIIMFKGRFLKGLFTLIGGFIKGRKLPVKTKLFPIDD